MKKLTSIRLRLVMNFDMPELDLYCPNLTFGRRKPSRYKFPIVFNDEKPATELCEELIQLIGNTLDEVKAASEPLYEKYKKFDYRFLDANCELRAVPSIALSGC